MLDLSNFRNIASAEADEPDDIEVIEVVAIRPTNSGGGGGFSSVPIFTLSPPVAPAFELPAFEIDFGSPFSGPILFSFNGVTVEIDPSQFTTEQIGSVFHFFESLTSNPTLRAAFERLDTNGNTISLRLVGQGDAAGYRADGSITTNGGFQPGQSGFISELLGSDGFAQPNTTIFINIDVNAVTSLVDFQTTLVHEVAHIAFSNNLPNEEAIVTGLENSLQAEFYRVGGNPNGAPIDVSQFAPGNLASGNGAANNFNGGSGNDNLLGNGGNDTLSGASGNDNLEGGAGNDRLNGGSGNDLLNGGSGNDLFVFNANTGGFDTVIDSGGVDRITITNTSINSLSFEELGANLLVAGSGNFVLFIENFFTSNSIETFTIGGINYSRAAIEAQTNNVICGDAFCDPAGGFGFSATTVGDSISAEVRIDIDNNGLSTSDGVLAIDRNGNGSVDGSNETSFEQNLIGAQSNLEALLGFDTNADGVLNNQDDDFNNFLIFQDLNNDGISQANELQTLSEAGIVSIDLSVSDNAGNAVVNFIDDSSSIAGTLNLLDPITFGFSL